jgi:tetratricopeptide (TPR) repeat protein
MRYPVPNIRLKLQAVREPRKSLASTLVATGAGHFVVLTLAPLKAARLMGQGPRALWETRVHESDPEMRVGLGSALRYAAFSATESEALARHEALVARLEAGTFETETAREVLAPIRPLMDRGAEAFKAGDRRGAVAAFDEAIRVARQLDAVRHFLHLYQEAFLMRALTLECLDPDGAKAAYRELIQLYADLPSHHPETLCGVARAREAIERLTPTPHEGSARRRIPVEEQTTRRSR